MSVVKIQSNASNTGIFTLLSPDSSSDRTLTLPDAAGTFISSGNLTDITNVGTLGSGLTVTGTITADGLTVDSNEKITLGAYGGEASIVHQSPNDGGGIDIKVGGSLTARFLNSKNIAFYEDTGTTAKFFWDASSERLGIGTTSPSLPLHVVNSSTSYVLAETTGTGTSAGVRMKGDASADYTLFTTQGTNQFAIYDNAAGTERVRITSAGNVGIGTSSPTTISGYRSVHLSNTSGSLIDMGTSGKESRIVADTNGLGFQVTPGSHTYQNIRWKAGAISGALDSHMLLDSNGHVGIGETAPLGSLHIKSEDTGAGSTPASTGNLLVLEGTENGMTIFSAGSGAGYINFGDSSNNTSGMIIYDHSANAMKFWANAAQRMMLDQNGDLQYGKTDATQNTQGIILNSYGAIRANSQADVALHLIRSTAGNIVRFYHNNTTLVGNINVTSTGTSYGTTSDYRLKENVVELTGAIDRIKQVPVHRFNFIVDADTTVDGFLAHEVADVVPEAITGTKDEVDDEGNPVYQGIDQSKLVPLLTQALKDAITKIEAQETTIASLTSRIEALETP